MNKATLQSSFSLEQIQFLEQSIFDVLESDFNYSLGKRKRELVLARALGSCSADALRQRFQSEIAVMESRSVSRTRHLEIMVTDAWMMIHANKFSGSLNIIQFIDSIRHIKEDRAFSTFTSLKGVIGFLKESQSLGSLKGDEWRLLHDIGVDFEKSPTDVSKRSEVLYEPISNFIMALDGFVKRESQINSGYAKTIGLQIAGEGEISMWAGRVLPVIMSVRLIHMIDGAKGSLFLPFELSDLVKIAYRDGYPKSIMLKLHMLLRSLGVSDGSASYLRASSEEQYGFISMHFNKFIEV